MDPCIGWEEDRASIKTMNDNLQQVKLLAVKISNENSPWVTKIRWDTEISLILKNVDIA